MDLVTVWAQLFVYRLHTQPLFCRTVYRLAIILCVIPHFWNALVGECCVHMTTFHNSQNTDFSSFVQTSRLQLEIHMPSQFRSSFPKSNMPWQFMTTINSILDCSDYYSKRLLCHVPLQLVRNNLFYETNIVYRFMVKREFFFALYFDILAWSYYRHRTENHIHINGNTLVVPHLIQMYVCCICSDLPISCILSPNTLWFALLRGSWNQSIKNICVCCDVYSNGKPLMRFQRAFKPKPTRCRRNPFFNWKMRSQSTSCQPNLLRFGNHSRAFFAAATTAHWFTDCQNLCGIWRLCFLH